MNCIRILNPNPDKPEKCLLMPLIGTDLFEDDRHAILFQGYANPSFLCLTMLDNLARKESEIRFVCPITL